MKELIRLLDLADGSWVRISYFGIIFSFARCKDDTEGCIRVKPSKTDEEYVYCDWIELCRFLRSKANNEIKIDNECLYQITLTAVALAFVNEGNPAANERERRSSVLEELMKDEPIFIHMMHYFYR